MTYTPDIIHVPIRYARARLSTLCRANNPTVILNQRWPTAILVPVPRAYQLSPGQRRRLRPRLRTQFRRLLLEILPEGR